MRPLIVLLSSAWLLLAAHDAASAAPAEDDVVLTAFEGAVEITARNAPLAPRAGAVLALAASLQTGADGSAELRQGGTSIAVGPDTGLEFPAPETAGPLERVAQPAGNAFYDVGPRVTRKLRVETPFLVAVIKGTQFNVAVTADSSTISLHEGVLEILAPEGGITPVTLRAGEVAMRRKDEAGIRVLKVGAAALARAAAEAARPRDPDGATPQPGGLLPRADDGAGDELVLNAGLPTLGVDPDVTGPAGASAAVALGAGVDLGAGSVEVGAAAALGTETLGVDAGLDAGVDLGAGSVDVGAGAGVDAGIASVDVGLGAGVDLGTGSIDVGATAGVDAGVGSVDAGIGAGVDLGTGSVDAGVDAGLDTGVGTVDAGVDAGVDLGTGTVDAGVDAGVAGVDAGVDVGVDLSGGDAGVGVSVDVLGTDIDLGLGGSETPGAESPAGSPEPQQPGGILGGLLGRPRT